MSIDKFLKEHKIVVETLELEDEDTFHIKYRVLKELLEKYHQSKVKENDSLHSVSNRLCHKCSMEMLEQDKEICIDCWQKYVNI